MNLTYCICCILGFGRKSGGQTLIISFSFFINLLNHRGTRGGAGDFMLFDRLFYNSQLLTHGQVLDDKVKIQFN